MLKINNIIFGLDAFQIRWHEGLWAIYKAVEMQEVYLEPLNQKNKKLYNESSLIEKVFKH